MTVENANYINQLNPAWPTNDDYGYEGDDQIRLVKKAVQQSFPNIGSEVLATPSELNQLHNVGAVIIVGEVRMYVGATAPDGWLLCNGGIIPPEHDILIGLIGPNTPDLRGQFIRGWSDDADVDPDGPRLPLTTQDDDLKEHSHTITGSFGNGSTRVDIGTNGTNRSTSTNPTGGDETRPKNMALVFIIKT